MKVVPNDADAMLAWGDLVEVQRRRSGGWLRTDPTPHSARI